MCVLAHLLKHRLRWLGACLAQLMCNNFCFFYILKVVSTRSAQLMCLLISQKQHTKTGKSLFLESFEATYAFK